MNLKAKHKRLLVLLEKLIYGAGNQRRFTQDSPILPDVWLQYARLACEKEKSTKEKRLGLIITPRVDSASGEPNAGALAVALRDESSLLPNFPPDIIQTKFLDSVVYAATDVAANATFEGLFLCLLPRTLWWRVAVKNFRRPQTPISHMHYHDELRSAVTWAILDMANDRPASYSSQKSHIPAELVWLGSVAGPIAAAFDGHFISSPNLSLSEAEHFSDSFLKLFWRALDRSAKGDNAPLIWMINRNRPVSLAVEKSRRTIKADAAFQVFGIKCDSITWAIVDGGIKPARDIFDGRITASYDFTGIHRMLDPATLDEFKSKLAQNIDPSKFDEACDEIDSLKHSLVKGRAVDWGLLEPLLKLGNSDNLAPNPNIDHGTHVASILGGNRQEGSSSEQEAIVGICPEIRLLDLRVIDDEGGGSEFNVIAALQFIRYLNANSAIPKVHGANLSLSIRHEVANFACGRTPVCDEAERLVASGVVVVAAAGNLGHLRYVVEDGASSYSIVAGYNTVSITDPGNAQNVITVGSTHRDSPHTYGVSYFSSRGPTGDGRAKPDLVAPGEKIKSAVANGDLVVKDGTSMAAPHVSAAAAMLMARHSELIGQPQRIKKILCDSAIDLGRERYFQGAGILDVLRALQSV